MTALHTKERVGWLLFFAGLVIMLVEYGLHVVGHLHGVEYRIGLGPIGIGAVFTFIGWFWLYQQDALAGGKFILDGFLNTLGILRTGRRATDVAVVVPPPAAASPPAPPPPPIQPGE